MPNINELLAWIDARRRAAAGEVGNLLTSPVETAQRLGGNVAQDFAQQSRGLLDASQNMRSAIPELRQEAQDRLMSGLLNMGGMAGVMTYHGTPHTIKGAYDLSKVGTGQGAQSFGHGIYFAENPSVAESYKNILGGTEIAEPSGKVLFKARRGIAPEDVTAHDRAASFLDYAFNALGPGQNPYEYARSVARTSGDAKAIQEAQDVISKWEQVGAKPKVNANLYKQDLPDEVLPSLLQWDKPLSEQPESVKKILDSIKVPRTYLDDSGKVITEHIPFTKQPAPWPMNAFYGEQAYKDLGPERLRSLGIPGLSYLDAGSRALPGGPKWKVTFPDGKTSEFNFKPSIDAMPQGTKIDEIRGTLNHVIWDQGLLNRMIPTPVE